MLSRRGNIDRIIVDLPKPISEILQKFMMRLGRIKMDVRIRKALFSGPPYYPDPDKILIDVTMACPLGCQDCNRSCGPSQAPATHHIRMGQIEHFIEESIAQSRKWKSITLEGGEPTCHPDLLGIINLLAAYCARESPSAVIEVTSNGYGSKARQVLRQLPSGVRLNVSEKAQPSQRSHCRFNVAPVDLPSFRNAPFEQGCYLPTLYGIGLTSSGFYPHPVCGSIDRVFGFDIGRRQLPQRGDRMADLMGKLCQYCGHFRQCHPRRRAAMREEHPHGYQTASWRRAYEIYSKSPPLLTSYGGFLFPHPSEDNPYPPRPSGRDESEC